MSPIDGTGAAVSIQGCPNYATNMMITATTKA
jgi:hypothetical protein